MIRNTYSFPTDPAWWPGHECPECEDAEHPCADCLASLRETDAGLDEADGRREG